MYRLEIQHTVEIDRIPVERLDALTAEWLAFPAWKRILRRSPLQRIGHKLTTEHEPVDGSFETLEAAIAGAERKAQELAGVIRKDSPIAIIRTSDDEVVSRVFSHDRKTN